MRAQGRGSGWRTARRRRRSTGRAVMSSPEARQRPRQRSPRGGGQGGQAGEVHLPAGGPEPGEHPQLHRQGGELRPGGEEDLFQLGLDPLPGDLVQHPGVPGQGGGRLRLQGKAQLGGEADRPQQPQAVLPEAPVRVPHAADQPRSQVGLPSEGVRYGPVPGQGHGVDGKVPPGQVLPKAHAEGHGIGPPAIPVALLPAEGGDLQRHVPQKDGDGAVPEAGGEGPGKEGQDLLRQGRGGHIPVPGGPPQQGVPDAAPHREGLRASPPQSPAAGAHRLRHLIPVHFLPSPVSFSCLRSIMAV